MITGKQLKAIATLVPTTKDYRPNLECVWLTSNEIGKARIWATSGHYLIIKTFDEEGPELPMAYRVGDIKRLQARDEVKISPNGLEHTCLAPPIQDAPMAPDIDAVIPSWDDNPRLSANVFGVNPLYLAKGMKALEALSESGEALFQLDDGILGPILISSDNGAVKFVLMPRRRGNEKSVNQILEGRYSHAA